VPCWVLATDQKLRICEFVCRCDGYFRVLRFPSFSANTPIKPVGIFLPQIQQSNN
jgi:hypothetical protein